MRELVEAIKLLKFKTRILLRGDSSLHIPEEPHLDPIGVEMFTSLVKGARYLEYGGGGSTIWAAANAKQVVCVESDLAFARALSDRVAGVYHGDIGLTREWGKPVFTRPTPARLAKWANYIELPWRYMNDPDVVMVDGRFRIACCLYSLIQRDVVVMLDDYKNRPHYRVLEGFASVESVGRVALLRRRQDFDPESCKGALNNYVRDWR